MTQTIPDQSDGQPITFPHLSFFTISEIDRIDQSGNDDAYIPWAMGFVQVLVFCLYVIEIE